MFFGYLRRELTRRKKQTSFVALGLAVSIGLVVVVNAAAGSIKTAQAQVLSGLYGIGTDISISKVDTTFQRGSHRFDFPGRGPASGSNTFSRSILNTQPGVGTETSSYVTKVAGVAGVSNVTATLKLDSLDFSGSLPTNTGSGNQNQGGSSSPGTGTLTPPTFSNGGGNGGSHFDINRVTVEGIQTSANANKVGPLSTVTISTGRSLTSSDLGKYVAVANSTYATSSSLKVGSTVTVASKKFTIVGIAKSTSTSSASVSDLFIPLDVAQNLSGKTGAVSNIYVSATSADQIPTVKAAIQKLDKAATVNTASDLASQVTGTLGTASDIVNNLGAWLSLVVLAGAFLIAIFFTLSGVNRRVREFGTLKALGWKSRRIVLQVLGESLITSLLGGVVGIGLGLGGIELLNKFAPSLSASIQSATGFGHGFGPMGPGGFGPGHQTSSANAVHVALNASASVTILLAAIGFALLGGLLAGAFGGARAAKLSPAQALRSVE